MDDDGVYEVHTPQVRTTEEDSIYSHRVCDMEDIGAEHDVLKIANDGAPFRVAASAQGAALRRAGADDPCIAELRVAKGRVGSVLVMIAPRRGVLVNGVPALGMTVLRPRDTLTLIPGVPSFVTFRCVPYVGRPPRDLIGQRCPACKLVLTEDTRIVRHRCGLGYHHETAESHPDVADEDRLNCFETVRTCLSCHHPLTLAETLVWDPASI